MKPNFLKNKEIIPFFCAIAAAGLYAASTPVSKVCLEHVGPTTVAGLLYIGAGVGMLAIVLLRKGIKTSTNEKPLTRRELPYIAAMIILDIAAPICLMYGLKTSAASSVSLLGNFEIVATSIISFAVFKEIIPKKLWYAVFLITAASMLLSVNNTNDLSFSNGSFFIILACIFWGFENNCTQKMSLKDPMQTVVIKGIFSGAGAIIVASLLGENTPPLKYIAGILCVGFLSYGFGIYLYIYAQRKLGAAKTSACYAVAPFIGVAASVVFLREEITFVLLAATAIMIVGTYMMITANTNDELKPSGNIKKNAYMKDS